MLLSNVYLRKVLSQRRKHSLRVVVYGADLMGQRVQVQGLVVGFKGGWGFGFEGED